MKNMGNIDSAAQCSRVAMISHYLLMAKNRKNEGRETEREKLLHYFVYVRSEATIQAKISAVREYPFIHIRNSIGITLSRTCFT